MFLHKLRCILQLLGLPAKYCAAHIFRRDGASFAFQASVLIELIKMRRDWPEEVGHVPNCIIVEAINQSGARFFLGVNLEEIVA